jgi:hypothetical protein
MGLEAHVVGVRADAWLVERRLTLIDDGHEVALDLAVQGDAVRMRPVDL